MKMELLDWKKIRVKSRKHTQNFYWTLKKESQWRDVCSRYSQRWEKSHFFFTERRKFIYVYASINADVNYMFEQSFLFQSCIKNFLTSVFDWCLYVILMKENNFWGYLRYLPHITTHLKHNNQVSSILMLSVICISVLHLRLTFTVKKYVYTFRNNSLCSLFLFLA